MMVPMYAASLFAVHNPDKSRNSAETSLDGFACANLLKHDSSIHHTPPVGLLHLLVELQQTVAATSVAPKYVD